MIWTPKSMRNFVIVQSQLKPKSIQLVGKYHHSVDDLQSNLSYTLKPLRKIDTVLLLQLAWSKRWRLLSSPIKRSATQSWNSSVVWLEVFSNTFGENRKWGLQSFTCSTIPRLGACTLNDMLFNADKSHFSSMNIKIHLSVMSAGQKRRLLRVSLLFTFSILFRRKDIAPFCRLLLHCLRQVKDIAKDSFTDFALNRAFICKWENLNIKSSGISSKVLCVPCCLVACISSVELLFSLVPAATVSTIYSSFVLLSSVQFTFIIPVVFDGIACVKCVIYFKSRNVFNQAIAWWGSVIRFNEWLRKLIVLCCCCQGWKLEADGWLMFVVERVL